MEQKVNQCDSTRSNVILGMTFFMIVALCVMLIYGPAMPPGVESSMTLALGMFVKGWMTCLDFEFGSSRGERGKDATIADSAKASAATASAAAGQPGATP